MLSRGYPGNGRLTCVIWGYQDVMTTGVGAFSEVGCGRVTEDNLKCVCVYGDLNTDRWQILLCVNHPLYSWFFFIEYIYLISCSNSENRIKQIMLENAC